MARETDNTTRSPSPHLDGCVTLVLLGSDVADLRGEGGEAAEGTLDGHVPGAADELRRVSLPPQPDHGEGAVHAERVATREHSPLRGQEEGDNFVIYLTISSKADKTCTQVINYMYFSGG